LKIQRKKINFKKITNFSSIFLTNLETQKQIKKLLFIETNNAEIEVVINSFVRKKSSH